MFASYALADLFLLETNTTIIDHYNKTHREKTRRINEPYKNDRRDLQPETEVNILEIERQQFDSNQGHGQPSLTKRIPHANKKSKRSKTCFKASSSERIVQT